MGSDLSLSFSPCTLQKSEVLWSLLFSITSTHLIRNIFFVDSLLNLESCSCWLYSVGNSVASQWKEVGDLQVAPQSAPCSSACCLWLWSSSGFWISLWRIGPTPRNVLSCIYLNSVLLLSSTCISIIPTLFALYCSISGSRIARLPVFHSCDFFPSF